MKGISLYLTVGMKALVGSIIAAFLTWIFIAIAMVALAGRPALMFIAGLALLLLNVIANGWILNALWKWK